MRMIRDVLQTTGITATAGIGPNLFLCKVAMDIEAKHIQADKDGVRIAELDERSFREKMWTHRPLTDFWRVGRGYATRLEATGMYTLGDVARMSVKNEDVLYRMFVINAELLIDHAWSWEPCTIQTSNHINRKITASVPDRCCRNHTSTTRLALWFGKWLTCWLLILWRSAWLPINSF